jgi:hypothetical protein
VSAITDGSERISRLRAAKRKRFARAFTLVELVVALSAGIAVAGAAYMLSKASLGVFEAEARLSQAQFGATMGMNRLISDVQRAGFMANPNFVAEPGKACGQHTNFASITAVRIFPGGSSVRAPVSVANGLSPDRIRLVGNFVSTEQFEFRTIQGNQVYMTMRDGAMQRTLQANSNGGPSLAELFRPARYVRLVDSHGKETYSTILSVSCGGPCDNPNIIDMTITLASLPATDGMVCGDWVSGGLINPVNIIDYFIGNPDQTVDGISNAAKDLVTPQTNDPQMAAIIAQTGDLYRTELIRTEMFDVNGNVKTIVPPPPGLPSPGEVVAEYAVDLKFSAVVRTAGTNPTLTRLDGDSAADSATIAGTPAQQFVGLNIRLATRTRAPDRSISLSTNPRSRFDVFGGNPAGTADHFARVRTLTEEVALPNLGGLIW